MPWRTLDHTADVGVVVTAHDREALFVEALRAMSDCITRLERVRASPGRSVRLAAADVELLLVDWLSEALYRFEVEGFVAAGARVEIVDRPDGGLTLTGKLLGELHDPRRHPHKVAIKAITYHRLEVVADESGWRATVIFDI